MARIRKFVCYRAIERPYTRISKYKDKSFIRITPHPKVTSFENGNPRRKFENKLLLQSKADLQIRDNALESARQTANRFLEKNLGTSSFFMKLMKYPHHILRENPIAQGAGADRFSTGMQKAFGKPIGIAAQIFKGHTIFEVSVNKANIAQAKTALERASKKLPCSCHIEITQLAA